MPADQAVNPIVALVPYLFIFLIFWFLLIKPQKDREQNRKKMVDNLIKNDYVVTGSGIHGRVVQVKEKTVVLRVDDNAKIEFDKDAIASLVKTKEDQKS